MKERLEHIKVGELWYWHCTVCGRDLASHECGRGKWKVMQSKGAASRHLERHDYLFVHHGRSVQQIFKNGSYICRHCGNVTIGKNMAIDWYGAPRDDLLPTNRRWCYTCKKWLSDRDIKKPRRKHVGR